MHVQKNDIHTQASSLCRYVSWPALFRILRHWGTSASISNYSASISRPVCTDHSLAAHVQLSCLRSQVYVFTRASILNISSASTCACRERPCYQHLHNEPTTGTCIPCKSAASQQL